jgi:site-specific DNA-methyltransferase (adenine-specific)
MKSEVFNIDCMEYMMQFADNHFELAIVDPPYGIGVAKNGFSTLGDGGFSLAKRKNYGAKNWDSSAPNKKYFDELVRISKNQIIWGANHFISRIPFDSSCWIVWDKNNGTFSMADCELAYTSFKTAVRKFEFTWNGMLQQNMKDKENRIHPTQKPIALYRWLLKNYANIGDKILDTHLGSGSSRIAADMEGFDFYGCELDQDYFDQSCKRFNEYKLQTKLF